MVDKYLVVGVTEQMEDFVAVLESALPCFFRGALDLYRQGRIFFSFALLDFIWLDWEG